MAIAVEVFLGLVFFLKLRATIVRGSWQEGSCAPDNGRRSEPDPGSRPCSRVALIQLAVGSLKVNEHVKLKEQPRIKTSSEHL